MNPWLVVGVAWALAFACTAWEFHALRKQDTERRSQDRVGTPEYWANHFRDLAPKDNARAVVDDLVGTATYWEDDA